MQGKILFSENKMEISDFEHNRMLKFSRHTHTHILNTIFEYCHVRVISEIQVTLVSLFIYKGFYISDLEFV